MHGPPGPPGLPGPPGSPGPRGAVGPQGKLEETNESIDGKCSCVGDVGRSKDPVPIVAFIAYLQKMLSVETNRSETIIFEQADVNEGNSYNASTGIFTATHRGIYKFSMTIMAQMDSIVRVERNRSAACIVLCLGHRSNRTKSAESARHDPMRLSTSLFPRSKFGLCRIGGEGPSAGRSARRHERSGSICPSK